MQLAPIRAQKHEFANRTWIEYFMKLVCRIEISLSLILLAKLIQIRGAFSMIQDNVHNTTTVNRTFLTVMLLFNLFCSLQFTTMFPLFYKLAGTRSIKFFLLAPVEIFVQNAVEHLHRF